jgi:ABC-type transport system involved in multi-copper enzyme maturation permease subunit
VSHVCQKDCWLTLTDGILFVAVGGPSVHLVVRRAHPHPLAKPSYIYVYIYIAFTCHYTGIQAAVGSRSRYQSRTMATPIWFVMLACLGALYVASVISRLLAFLSLCLRQPKDLHRSYGEWAIVTGPTSGLGRSMALELARRGLNLVLLDLNAANLRETSDTIKSSHDVKTKTVVFDLSLVGTAQGDNNVVTNIALLLALAGAYCKPSIILLRPV